MPGLIATDSIYDPTGRETIRQQRVVGMMVMEPCHGFPGLWVKDELTTLQAYGSPFAHTSATHYSLNIAERKMFYWPFLPNVAVLTPRLTERG